MKALATVMSLVCLALFLRVWQPRDVWRFPDEAEDAGPAPVAPTGRALARAWAEGNLDLPGIAGERAANP